MKEEGVKAAKHIHDFSFMGFTEVLKNILSISNNLNYCKRDIIKFNPQVLVLIDFPGFNLNVKFMKQKESRLFIIYLQKFGLGIKEESLK